MNILGPDNQHTHQPITADDLHHIFSRFSPQDVEGFYQLYQIWQLQQKRTEVQQQLRELEDLLSTKESSLLAVTPSAIAQAAISQFRASSIDDSDLLERMLARGDHWLDHTWELFERCKRLGMIQDNAIEWCEHALEDAYEWMESISSLNDRDNNLLPEPLHPSHQQLLDAEELLPTTTEEDFLHKLMNDEESGPSTASDATAEQKAIPSTSSQETFNLRQDNDQYQVEFRDTIFSDAEGAGQAAPLRASKRNACEIDIEERNSVQDAHSTAEEQPQPENPAEAMLPLSMVSTLSPSADAEQLQLENPAATEAHKLQQIEIEKKPQMHTIKPKRGFFLQLLLKILQW